MSEEKCTDRDRKIVESGWRQGYKDGLEKGRVEEHERIIRKLEEFAKNPCGEGKYCEHSYDDIGCEKCVALKVIELVRGGE